MTTIKRRPRSLNLLERTLLKAIKEAGVAGLADADVDHIFKKRIQRDKRVQVFAKLRGLGLIESSRSPGGGTLYKTVVKPRAPQDNKQEQRAGFTWRNHQWEPADPTLLKSFTCTLWPNLSVSSLGKSIQFRNGRCCTSDPELVALIEKAHGFGTHILQDEIAVEIDEAEPPQSIAIHW
jgi:hypothetical protein